MVTPKRLGHAFCSCQQFPPMRNCFTLPLIKRRAPVHRLKRPLAGNFVNFIVVPDPDDNHKHAVLRADQLIDNPQPSTFQLDFQQPRQVVLVFGSLGAFHTRLRKLVKDCCSPFESLLHQDLLASIQLFQIPQGLWMILYLPIHSNSTPSIVLITSGDSWSSRSTSSWDNAFDRSKFFRRSAATASRRASFSASIRWNTRRGKAVRIPEDCSSSRFSHRDASPLQKSGQPALY